MIQQMRAVLILSGETTEVNCAIPELIEICQGYGLSVDLVKEIIPEGVH